MLGSRQEAQGALFYEFSIEDHVPQDHLLRSIDRFVELSSIRQHLAPFYSNTGRPSINPELLIRMLLVGYCLGIRSERRLCKEVHLNLAYRWFCRLDLTDRVPDHSTFSKNRYGRFRDSELLRHLFETVVARCIAEGLVSGQRMAIDARLIHCPAGHCTAMFREGRRTPTCSTLRRRKTGIRRGSTRRPRRVPCVSIWRFSTRRPSARPRRWSESSPPSPIRLASASRDTAAQCPAVIDCGAQGSGVLQLFRQLSRRHRPRRDPRRRDDEVDPPGGGRVHKNHARAGEGALRSPPRARDRPLS
ncbi:Transposase [Jannaschia faecimaris]|uniref:Transposase n=1 Tax=Jannaschia faecimaris TaxID=1244108 RepID=A0A1H3PN55_9RHOB|nr:Transposase [Jannaschia faecimaris]